MKSIDLGDGCVICRKSTQFGSGRFVNRVPANIVDPSGQELEGWICAECQRCEDCGQEDCVCP